MFNSFKTFFILVIIITITIYSCRNSNNKYPIIISESMIENNLENTISKDFNPIINNLRLKKINQNINKKLVQNIIGLRDTIPEFMDGYYFNANISQNNFNINIFYYSGAAGGCQENYYIYTLNDQQEFISTKMIAYMACEGEIIYIGEAEIKEDLTIFVKERKDSMDQTVGKSTSLFKVNENGEIIEVD